MALTKQNISISFSQGVDTKTDPNQVVAGKLISAQNISFATGMSFSKRNGYNKLATFSNGGVGLATYQSEVVGFDGKNLQSYSPSTQTVISKGAITSVDLSVTSVYRSTSSQTTQDSAFHISGLYLYVWVDSINGAQYVVVSQATGAQVITVTNLPANAIYPRAWCVGNFLLVTYVDTSTNHLRYISIPVYTLTPASPVDISLQVNTSNRYYDGVIANGSLFLAWNASDVGNAVRMTYLDAQLNLHNTFIQVSEAASNCIGVWSDTGVSGTPTIWVAYFNGTNIRYFIVSTNGLVQVLAPTTAVGSVSGILNITGYSSNNSGTILYQTQNTYSYSSVRTDFISSVTANSVGSVGTAAVFLRGVGLISKPFVYNSVQYFVVAYSGTLQQTYFVVNTNGTIIAKLAYTNGGGYTTNNIVCTVNSIASTQFQFAYLFKSELFTQSGSVFTNTGVNSVVVDFASSDVFQTAEIGENLNINGGFLWAYDGYRAVEQNFHVFPEDTGYTATTGSGAISANSYSYISLYEWADNQGNIQYSGYGTPLSVVIGAATTGITVAIPTARLTQKSNIQVTLYRTAPSVSTGIYYKVSSQTTPVLSSTAVDSVQITDTSTDATIIGNQLLYTTGGIVQNTGGPAASAITIFKNRLFVLNSENRNTLTYSKQTLQGTPVEMSDNFTQFIDPRFGVMTAIAVMDDKLIIFKANAIFYQVGDGPDATGANNDFTEPVFVTSVVGTSNPKSVVLMQDGIMFQSNKGIWLLDRSLSVSYIGAPVEAFNDATVTSAVLIPNTTQVRFTLTTGIALVYDYFYKQWATFTNHPAVAAVNAQGTTYTYLTATGLLLQETAGVWTDNGVPYFMSLSTSWLSFAGFQGYQRAYRVFFKGQFMNAHVLNVAIGYDFNSAMTQVSNLQPTNLANTNYGNDPLYGSTQYYGGNSQEEQYRINLVRQKCQSIQISIQEALDTSNPVYGPAINLEAIGIVIGAKGTYPRLPASQAVT